MNCFFHPNKSAIAGCVNCGKLLCDECATVIQNKNYCKSCIIEFSSETISKTRPPSPLPKTDGLAIASMVCGILGFFPCWGIILGILGIIFGNIAKNRIKVSTVKVEGIGMATAGIVLGTIFTILWLLLGLLYMVFGIAMWEQLSRELSR